MGPLEPIDSRRREESPSVFSTTRDVATFGQMVLNGGTYGGARILSRPAVTEMTPLWKADLFQNVISSAVADE